MNVRNRIIVAAALVGVAASISVWWWSRTGLRRGPVDLAPAPTADAGAPTGSSSAADLGSEAPKVPAEDARHSAVTAAEEVAAAAAELERLRERPGLAVAQAEVVAVAPASARHVGDRSYPFQRVDLRILRDEPRAFARRYRILEVVICPDASAAEHGCSMPFDSLRVGEVRDFVLARGRPDFGALGEIMQGAQWIVFAGPVQDRPQDPLLDKLPPHICRWLSDPRTSVFRGVVRSVDRRATPLAALKLGVDTTEILEIEPLEVLQAIGVDRGARIKVATPASAPGGGDWSVGAEYWMATNWVFAWHVLVDAADAAR